MNKRQITLHDLAVKLKISASTVSRALKDHPRISRKTKEAVWKLAKDLDYEPNQLALSFKNTHINAIGVVVPKIIYHLYATAISGIESYANARGYNIMICQSNESMEREKAIVNELIASRVAGFIVSLSSETDNFDHFVRLQNKGIPLVFFNRECENVQADRVIIDNFQAAYDAVDHLISTGCKKIAYMGGPGEVQISNQRMKGYRQALTDNHLEANSRLILHCEFNRESALTQARKLVYGPEPPEAILAFSDQIAISAIKACKERGLKIPEDISIVGFNNEPVTELLEPPLTSIDQPGFLMGKAAAELLIRQIENEGAATQPEKRILSANLIVRKSTNRNRS